MFKNMKNPHLIYAHKSTVSEYTTPFHSHNYYELVYYRYGIGAIHFDGSPHDFSSGTFVLLPPQLEHSDSLCSECEWYCICFQAEEQLTTGLFADNQEIIFKIIKKIVFETTQQYYAYPEMIGALLTELVIMLKRFGNTNYKQNKTKSFEYVANYIAENYQEKILLKELADQINFSYHYFQHQFKKLFGIPPQQFLVQKRIEAAKNMLEDNSLSCTEIAYRCGFSNSAQFSIIFKREYGISPQQYRRKTQESRPPA